MSGSVNLNLQFASDLHRRANIATDNDDTTLTEIVRAAREAFVNDVETSKGLKKRLGKANTRP